MPAIAAARTVHGAPARPACVSRAASRRRLRHGRGGYHGAGDHEALHEGTQRRQEVVIPERQYKPRMSSGKKPLQPKLSPPLLVEAQMPMATAIAMPILAHPVPDVACPALWPPRRSANAASVRCDTALRLSAPKTIVCVSPQTCYMYVQRQFCVLYELRENAWDKWLP